MLQPSPFPSSRLRKKAGNRPPLNSGRNRDRRCRARFMPLGPHPWGSGYSENLVHHTHHTATVAGFARRREPGSNC